MAARIDSSNNRANIAYIGTTPWYELFRRFNPSWCVCRDCHFGGHARKFLTAEANHDNH